MKGLLRSYSGTEAIMEHEPKIIAVFFTHGVSLELWEKRGMFSREVRFYEELAREVGEVWFFTYGEHDEQYLNRLGPNIRLFPKRCKCPPSHYALMLPFVYRKQLKQADVIRIHQTAGAIPALLAHWLLHKPLIVRCGYQWSKFLERTGASKIKQWAVAVIEKIAYDTAAFVIITSQEDLEYVAQRYAIERSKLNLIPNWVDTDLFKPMSVEKQPRTICFVGRLEEQKNLHALVKAMRGVQANLVLYGEGSQRTQLEDAAHEYGVNVEFRGRIANEELPAALNACEIFVLPSFYEGNPKVLLEAMACGLPVIGTRVEGIQGVIRDGENGVLCGTDVPSIHAALARLLGEPSTRQRLGASARETILGNASLSQAIHLEVGLLQHLAL